MPKVKRSEQTIEAGRRVRQKREAAGLTQLQLSKMLGYQTEGYISKIETARGPEITWKMSKLIGDALNVHPLYILCGLESDLSFMDPETLSFVSNPRNYPIIQRLIIDLKIKHLENKKKDL